MNSKQRRNVFQEVTDKVLAFLKQGVKKEWNRPWKKLFTENPVQVSVSNRPYTGLNQVLLMLARRHNDFKSNSWATYKAWQEKGYQVQKGQQGSDVTGWFTSEYIVKDAEGKVVIDKKTKKPKVNVVLNFRSWKVFNGSQVADAEGKPYKEVIEEKKVEPMTWNDEGDHIKKVNEIINTHKIDVRSGGNQAYYSPTGKGYIQMPKKEQFISGEHYYGTLTHEMIHWTGHDSRTNRHTKIKESKKDFNNNSYAFEELVAEIGSCFFDKYLNIENDSVVDNHLAYLQSWIEGLENNPFMIERASAYAQKAVDYLVETAEQEEEEVQAEEQELVNA